MSSGESGKSSRGPRGRRRQRGGGGGRQQSGGRNGGRGGGGKPRTQHDNAAPRKGKAFSSPYEVPESGLIAPFDLFCACYLGIMPDGSYRSMGLSEVAKRLNRNPNDLKQTLHDYHMDAEQLKKVGFDLSLAKLDMQVAPEGMDRRELARGLFEELLEDHPELEQAAQRFENGQMSAPAPKPKPAAVASQKPAPEPDDSGTEPDDQAVAHTDSADAQEGEEETVTAGTSPDQSRAARQIRRSPVRRGGGDS